MTFLVKKSVDLIKNFNPNTTSLERVIHNFSKETSSAQFLIVNSDLIDVVYENCDEEFKKFAQIATLSQAEKNQLDIPKHLIPVNCKNLT